MKKLIFAAALAAFCSARAELLIQNNDRIAFLGDSITANGNRPAGYVNMVMKGLELAGVKAEKVAVGELPDTDDGTTVTFESVPGPAKFVRFTALSPRFGGRWASFADLQPQFK